MYAYGKKSDPYDHKESLYVFLAYARLAFKLTIII
jgi:hypothetical protein